MNTKTADKELEKDLERVLQMVKQAENDKDYIIHKVVLGNNHYIDVNPRYYHFVSGLQVDTIVFILQLLMQNKDIYYSNVDKLYHIVKYEADIQIQGYDNEVIKAYKLVYLANNSYTGNQKLFGISRNIKRDHIQTAI